MMKTRENRWSEGFRQVVFEVFRCQESPESKEEVPLKAGLDLKPPEDLDRRQELGERGPVVVWCNPNAAYYDASVAI